MFHNWGALEVSEAKREVEGWLTGAVCLQYSQNSDFFFLHFLKLLKNLKKKKPLNF